MGRRRELWLLFSSESVSFMRPIWTDEISSMFSAPNVRSSSLFRLQLNFPSCIRDPCGSEREHHGLLGFNDMHFRETDVSTNTSPSSSGGRVSQVGNQQKQLSFLPVSFLAYSPTLKMEDISSSETITIIQDYYILRKIGIVVSRQVPTFRRNLFPFLCGSHPHWTNGPCNYNVPLAWKSQS
jgi:hypothetical protein